VYFNANGMPYEQGLSFLLEYARGVGCNAVTFNYQAVGLSGG